MISLFFIFLFTWHIREERKLPDWLRSNDPFLTAAIVTLYLFMFFLMGFEILALWLTIAAAILTGIATIIGG